MRRDIAIGMSDGSTVPLALAAGLSGMAVPSDVIVFSGLVIASVGAIAMGIGAWAAQRSTNTQTISSPDLMELGFSESQQEQAISVLRKEHKNLEEVISVPDRTKENNNNQVYRRAAITVAIAYFLSGLLVIFPYIVFTDPVRMLFTAAIIACGILVISGYYKAKENGINPLFGALLTMSIGIMAAGAAFGVAKLISGS